MKIIQMNLDDFGIYHDISWNPPDKGLIVMHGHNESGKTTLMKYVRAMFFGYPRGEWRGHLATWIFAGKQEKNIAFSGMKRNRI